MKTMLLLPLVAALSVAVASSATAALARPVLELADQFAKKSTARLSVETTEAMNRAFLRHGDKALESFRNGGPALAEAAARHGDELMIVAIRVPEAAPVLARRADELLPLFRQHGDDILRLEARVPGLAADAVRVFPDPSDIQRLAKLPADDAARTISFAARADSPETARRLLLEVERSGPGVLARLPAKQILAYGLSASMLSAAVIASTKSPEGLWASLEMPAAIVASSIAVAILLAGICVMLRYRRALHVRRA